MNESALVNKVAASTPAANTGPCTTCPTAGLPILLTRYAIAPKTAKAPALPAQCNNPYLVPADAKSIVLKETSYTLQTLRAGFVYLYYEVPDSKQWRWFCYMVSPLGMLREVPIDTPGPVEPKEIACTREGHNIKAAIIALPTPEKIDKVYLAYTEYFWGKATRDRYAEAIAGKSKRPYIGKERFVEFSPSAWMGNPNQAGAMVHVIGTNRIAEYHENDLSGRFQDSHFDFHIRKGEYPSLVKHMNAMNPGRGAVIALPDPIGCVTELNTYRLKAFKDRADYLSDPEVIWKHRCKVQIDGLRELMKKQAEKEVDDEAKKSHQYNPRRGPQQNRESKIASATESKLGDLTSHYDEDKYFQFNSEFTRRVDEAQKIIEAIDAEYSAWMRSESLAYTMGDHSGGGFWESAAYAEITERIKAGGVISEKSLELWKEFLKLEATDFKNYAIRGILFNQEKWLQAFKSGSEKTIGEHFADSGTIGKLYDIARNSAQSDGGKQVLEGAAKRVNQYGSALLNTVSGAIAAVSKSVSQEVAANFKTAGKEVSDAISKATAHLDSMQVKLGLAFSLVAGEASAILLKIEFTVDEWNRIVMAEINHTLTTATKESSKKLAVLALSARLRVPAGSAMADQLVEFTFWVLEKSDRFVKTLAAALGTTSEVLLGAGGQVVKTGTAAVRMTGQTATAAAEAVADGVKGVARRVTIVGHNLRSGAQVLARIPKQLAATEAIQAAGRLTRNSLGLAKSPDVVFASVAFGFQAYSLYKAIKDYGSSAGWKHQDAAWSIASSSVGVASAVVDLYGNSMIALYGKEVRVIGGRVAASTLVRWAGIAGAGASFVESFQAAIRCATFSKRGDSDAAWLNGIAAASAFVAGGAGIAIAVGYSAFFGPVGLLIVAIGIGLLAAYFAFMAEDQPVQIWLDRCKLGRNNRSEGAFKSMKQEMDALELVGRQVVVELEWIDTKLSLSTDEISVFVKRLHGVGDGVLYGLVVKGSLGEVRVYPRSQGIPTNVSYPWPQALSNDKTHMAIASDVKILGDQSSTKVIDGPSDGVKMVAVEDAWEVKTPLFDSADLYVRYFPDINKKDEYFDDVLHVAD